MTGEPQVSIVSGDGATTISVDYMYDTGKNRDDREGRRSVDTSSTGGGWWSRNSTILDIRQLVFYISGPYTGHSKRTIGLPVIHEVVCYIKTIVNIIRARNVAKKVWELGGTAICPQLNSMLFKIKGVWYHDYLDGDMRLIRDVDVVVMMRRWEKSFGCALELGEVRRINKCRDKQIKIIHEDELEEYIEYVKGNRASYFISIMDG